MHTYPSFSQIKVLNDLLHIITEKLTFKLHEEMQSDCFFLLNGLQGQGQTRRLAFLGEAFM
jgi:signal recognition particle GTPase